METLEVVAVVRIKEEEESVELGTAVKSVDLHFQSSKKFVLECRPSQEAEHLTRNIHPRPGR